MKHAAGAIAPAWVVETALAHWRQGGGLSLPDARDGLPQETADGLQQSIEAVTLDLPGEAATRRALIDVDGDGYLESTQWVTANQQLLAIDTDGDGRIGAGDAGDSRLQSTSARTLDGAFVRTTTVLDDGDSRIRAGSTGMARAGQGMGQRDASRDSATVRNSGIVFVPSAAQDAAAETREVTGTMVRTALSGALGSGLGPNALALVAIGAVAQWPVVADAADDIATTGTTDLAGKAVQASTVFDVGAPASTDRPSGSVHGTFEATGSMNPGNLRSSEAIESSLNAIGRNGTGRYDIADIRHFARRIGRGFHNIHPDSSPGMTTTHAPSRNASIRIRSADSNDIETIVVMGERMHAESRFSCYPMNRHKSRAITEMLVSNASAGCVLLAEHLHHGVIGMIAGYVTDYFFADVRVAQDKWFYVLPEHRGNSAAIKLMIAFRRWAENRQASELCVAMSVDIEQERFSRFMEHLDFRSCGKNFVLSLSLETCRSMDSTQAHKASADAFESNGGATRQTGDAGGGHRTTPGRWRCNFGKHRSAWAQPSARPAKGGNAQ